MKLPYLIVESPTLIVNFVKSYPPINTPIKGIIISFTSEDTIVLKAPPITTPTAKSITLPLLIKVLNSSNSPFDLVANSLISLISFLFFILLLSPTKIITFLRI